MRRKFTRQLRFENLEERSLLSATPLNDLLDAVENEITSDRVGQSLQFLSDSSSLEENVQQQSLTGGALIGLAPLQLSEDRVAVQAAVSGTSTLASLRTDLQSLGFQESTSNDWMASGWLPVASISALGGLNSLEYVRPLYAPLTSVGSADSQGHESQRTDLIADFLGLTGEGITVGVISDSYDNGGSGSAGTDIASGDLPGTGNMLGHTQTVNVFRDNLAGTDEGRAMLQIVHDVAPEAGLLFSNVSDAMGVQSQQAFAANIPQLELLGADVIVDDLVFFAEPLFSDGLIAQAVNAAANNGTVYVSAAGNFSADSYESGFVNSGVTDTFTFGGTNFTELLHDFGGGDTWQTIQFGGGDTISFQWDDPFFTVSPESGGATRNFDIIIRDSTTQNILFVSDDSVVGGDPVELVSNNGSTATFEVGIGLRNGINPGGTLKYVMYGSGSQISEHATGSSTTTPHANTNGAISVGAAAYFDTPEFDPAAPFVPPVLENFSSLGGVDILFDAAGNRLATPEVREGVDIVAPDGVNTTFFGQDIAQDTDTLTNFFGTSAAAPHVAGLAALLLQADPSLTPAGIETVLEQSAGSTGWRSLPV